MGRIITYLSKLIGTRSLAAFLHLELFGYRNCFYLIILIGNYLLLINAMIIL